MVTTNYTDSRRASERGRNTSLTHTPQPPKQQGCNPGRQMKPDWSLWSVVICAGTVAVLFVALGVIAFVTMNESKEFQIVYMGDDADSSVSQISATDTRLQFEFTTDAKFVGPVYVYVYLNWIFQNHKDMMMDVETYKQYAGNEVGDSRTIDEIEIESGEDKRGYNSKSFGRSPNRRNYPQGWNAGIAFNDTFVLERKIPATDANAQPTYETIPQDQTPDAINWLNDESRWNNLIPTDIVPGTDNLQYQQKLDMWALERFPPRVCRPKSGSEHPPVYVATRPSQFVLNGETVTAPVIDCSDHWDNLEQMTCKYTTKAEDRADANFHTTCAELGSDYEDVINPSGWGIENAHFVNWARPSALSPVRKLIAKIDDTFEEGTTIRVTVDNKWPSPSPRDKVFSISTASAFGAPNVAVYIIPLVTGFFWGLLAVAFVLVNQYASHSDKNKRHKFVWEHSPTNETQSNGTA